MTQAEYLSLYEKYIAGEATPDEIKEVLLYRDEFEMYVAVKDDEANEYSETKGRILNKLNKSTGQPVIVKLQRIKWWSSAAAILIFGTAGLLFLKNNQTVKPLKNTKTTIAVHDVAPGSNKAILTLASGKVISLNDIANGIISKQRDLTVKKQNGGIVEYVASAEDKDENPVTNSISTPRGGQYQLVLSDGTKVWLNAASSLKFPSFFAGRNRTVELTGEAYFEVAKNKKMPFIVKFNDANIEVLGTHFDIKAYDDEDTKATLAEGSIKISKNSQQKILVPGQQVVVSKVADNLEVSPANMDEALAWKNGYFIFHDASIQSIMKTAARWYDVDVAYDADIRNKKFGGRVSKYKNISELLKNMELTGTIHFKIEGRRITVLK
jgi:transmembrane sensor